MHKQHNRHLTVVVYDSITNSVFESQVLMPLLAQLKQSSNLVITLISFEKCTLSKRKIMRTIPAHERLHLILCRRLPFFGRISLKISAWQLKRILNKIPSHAITARGALAGWISYRALNRQAQKTPERMRVGHPNPFPLITVQTRGLAAEELRFTHQHKKQSFLKRLFFKYVYKTLHKIEFELYRNKRKTDFPNNVALEAVSPALKDYLISTFRADPAKITIATQDIPPTIAQKQKKLWRTSVRHELKISVDAYVYVYNGSARPWQCIPEMLFYFNERLKENHTSFLLILTPDVALVKKQCSLINLPEKHYRILNVHPKDVGKYLSACDAGLLFRRQDVINWVARPTKMLEYQAANLKIIHNNTVALLVHKEKRSKEAVLFTPASNLMKNK